MAEKNKKKNKKGDSQRSQEAATPYSSIATHPRASMRVRQAKGWGGLAGFAIAAVLALKAGVPIVQSLERALLFGVVGYLVAWSLSVLLWRQLMMAELKAAADEIKRRREELRAEGESKEESGKAAPEKGTPAQAPAPSGASS